MHFELEHIFTKDVYFYHFVICTLFCFHPFEWPKPSVYNLFSLDIIKRNAIISLRFEQSNSLLTVKVLVHTLM